MTNSTQQMSTVVAAFAVSHKIAAGRDHNGHYTIRNADRKVIALSLYPTAKSGMVMLKKYISQQ